MKLIEKLARNYLELIPKGTEVLPATADNPLYQQIYEAGFRAAREMAANEMDRYKAGYHWGLQVGGSDKVTCGKEEWGIGDTIRKLGEEDAG